MSLTWLKGESCFGLRGKTTFVTDGRRPRPVSVCCEKFISQEANYFGVIDLAKMTVFMVNEADFN